MLANNEILRHLRAFVTIMVSREDAANAHRWCVYGWVLIAVGMGFNANLFYSLGTSVAISLAIMIVGMTLDLVKLNALLTMAVSWARRDTLNALGNFFFLLLLSSISLAAGFGFWSVTNERFESQRVKESLPFVAAKENYEVADAQVKNLAEFAKVNINNEQAQLEAVEAEIAAFLAGPAKNSQGVVAGTIANRIGDCNSDGYYQRTYCTQLEVFKAKVIPHRQAVANAKAYQEAVAARSQARQDMLKNSSSGNAGTAAPIYVDIGRMLSIQPDSARLWLSSLITLVIELTALWCFVNFNRLGCEPEETTKQCPKPNGKPVPSTDSTLQDFRWRRPQMTTAFNSHGATATCTEVEEEISPMPVEPEEIVISPKLAVKKKSVRAVEDVSVAARSPSHFRQGKPFVKQEVQSAVKTTTDQIGRFARSLLGSKHSKVHE